MEKILTTFWNLYIISILSLYSSLYDPETTANYCQSNHSSSVHSLIYHVQSKLAKYKGSAKVKHRFKASSPTHHLEATWASNLSTGGG